MKLAQWLGENYSQVLQILTLILVVGEMITRLTPTKTDDGFVTRLGAGLDAVLTLLRVPNLRAKIKADDLDEEDDESRAA